MTKDGNTKTRGDGTEKTQQMARVTDAVTFIN